MNSDHVSAIKTLIKKHENIAIRLFEIIMLASKNRFMVNGSVYEPCKDVRTDHCTVLGTSFNNIQIKYSLDLLYSWVEKKQSTNVSTFF